jgi:serine/threonine-protein phosphatase 2A activator
MDLKAETYCVPQDRVIQTEEHIAQWQASVAHEKLIAFITKCNTAIMGKKISDAANGGSPLVHRLVAMLQVREMSFGVVHTDWQTRFVQKLEDLMEQYPPIEQSNRFGNKAFRDWHAKVVEEGNSLVEDMLLAEKRGASIELTPYLIGALGNPTRLDYGTGHETCFVVLLVILDEMKLFAPDDYMCVPLIVFASYLKVTVEVWSVRVLFLVDIFVVSM